ncbi:hypothetical protein [Microbacterium memoriense]|uniref:DUF1641 domain-containing protein n=1 Tax=Microbacterium memoriense TaxID=2978350 RepID=A0ABT2PDM0_9MICO|nr:hypothetical protein [Microbacterium memoriense]MCT9002606.1 hypothetical protein [Microbacterium memoriense]
MMDEYEEAVRRAVEAVRSEDDSRIVAAFDAMGSLGAEDIVAELCNWVEDATDGQDVATLVDNARLPLPDEPLAFVDAVRRNDLRALHELVGGDLGRLLASLLLLIASLQDAAGQE